MEFRNRWSLLSRLLTGALGVSCIVGAFLGLLNGYYLLALSQVLFATAMFMLLYGAETKRGAYPYLVWVCLGAGILLTAVASVF